MSDKRSTRRRIFAGFGILAGVVLIAFELARPGGSTTGERWFWMAVAVALVGLGIAEFTQRSSDGD